MSNHNIFITSALSLLLGLGLSSCSSFLEEEPRGLVTVGEFYSNDQEARQALNGVYRTLSGSEVTGHQIKQIPNDLVKRAQWDEGSGLSNFTYGSENPSVLVMWKGHYAVIKDCNSLIGNVEANRENIEHADRYIAQARAIRAFLYFDLVRWFGDVPLVITETKSLEDLEVSRAPKADVFRQIIADFTEGTVNCCEKGDVANGYQYGRMTQEACHGFLSKVYLWLGSVALRDGEEVLGSAEDNFKLAMEEARKVIDSGKYKLCEYYPDVFNAKTREKARDEVLFCIEGLTGDNTGTWTGMLFGIRGSQELGGSWDNISSSDYHRMIYEPSDSVRRLWNCPRVQLMEDGNLWGWDYRKYWDTRSDQKLSQATENNNWVQWSVGKFRRYPLASPGTYNYTNFGMDEPLLRYADVLLIYAEAYNEVNHDPGVYTPATGTDLTGSNIVSAFDAVNLVRKRARIANKGIIHEDPLPRELKTAYTNLTQTCVPDWRPGFFGYAYDGAREAASYHGFGSLYEAFRGELLFERARELVGEGTDRWCDLVRTGTFEKAMQSWRVYNPYISATERGILIPGAPENISRKHYVLPIPMSERDVNKNLTHNEGY